TTRIGPSRPAAARRTVWSPVDLLTPVSGANGLCEGLETLLLQQLLQLVQDPDRRRGVVEDGRPDLDRAGPGGHQLERVATRSHPPDPDDRDRPEPAFGHCRADLPDCPNRD